MILVDVGLEEKCGQARFWLVAVPTIFGIGNQKEWTEGSSDAVVGCGGIPVELGTMIRGVRKRTIDSVGGGSTGGF